MMHDVFQKMSVVTPPQSLTLIPQYFLFILLFNELEGISMNVNNWLCSRIVAFATLWQSSGSSCIFIQQIYTVGYRVSIVKK